MKMFWIAAVVFKIFSEVQDEIIDGAGIWINLITPNGLQDFFSFYHFIFIFYQQLKQHSFFFAQAESLIFFIERFLCLEVNQVGSKYIFIGYRIAFLKPFVFFYKFLHTK